MIASGLLNFRYCYAIFEGRSQVLIIPICEGLPGCRCPSLPL